MPPRPPSRPRRPGLALLGLAATVSLLVACADDDDPPDAPVPVEDVAPVLDWRQLPATAVVHEGWSFGSCGGTAPIACVTGPGGSGTLELLRYATDDLDVVEAALDAGASDLDAVRAFADEYVATFTESRPVECPGTTVEPDEVVELTVGGAPGLRYGFRVLDPAGLVVERAVQWARIEGADLLVVGAGALDPVAGCFEPIGEFTPEALGSVLPAADDIVAAALLRD